MLNVEHTHDCEDGQHVPKLFPVLSDNLLERVCWLVTTNLTGKTNCKGPFHYFWEMLDYEGGHRIIVRAPEVQVFGVQSRAILPKMSIWKGYSDLLDFHYDKVKWEQSFPWNAGLPFKTLILPDILLKF